MLLRTNVHTHYLLCQGFDADEDPEPTFYFDADPDPDPDPDPIPQILHRCHNFQYFGQYFFNFMKKV